MTTQAETSTLPPELDPRYGYRQVRYNRNDRERELALRRSTESWVHAEPSSVFVAAIGNHWKRGAWAKVMDMIHYTNQYGYMCVLEEIMDRCMNPYDSLGAMRNEAIMRASQGFEWLCYIDNDVYPEPSDLVELINRGQPVIAPYVMEPSSGKPLHGPARPLWGGVQPVRWCVLSMLVFRANVFASFTDGEFWNNAIGADEGYHFQKLWARTAHNPWIDTDIVLKVGGDPTYPLATLRMPKHQGDDFWEQRRNRLLEAPDRSPIDPNDRRISDIGDYLPFIQPRPAAK